MQDDSEASHPCEALNWHILVDKYNLIEVNLYFLPFSLIRYANIQLAVLEKYLVYAIFDFYSIAFAIKLIRIPPTILLDRDHPKNILKKELL